MLTPSPKPDRTNAPVRVSALTFNDKTIVDIGDAEIVVLVGPNNVGKTRTLQEIEQFLINSQTNPETLFALRDLSIERTTQGEQLVSWFREHRPVLEDPNNPGQDAIYTNNSNAGRLQLNAIGFSWGQSGSGKSLGVLGPHLVKTLYCGERLHYLNAAQRLDLGTQANHPLHLLAGNESLLHAFQDAFARAFGMNIIVDGWGAGIRLRVSRNHCQEDFRSTTINGLPDPDLVRRVLALPPVETQSDGVKSFTGILLTLLTGQFPVVLIDEPEAFLHPPQARLLGQHLAEWHRNGQVFVATHSLDILLGLIEKRPEKVLIVRLTRNSDIVSPHVLPPSRLVEISKDPLLRFSRTLDGLFHLGVVVCEGDTDSQFYSLVANRDRADIPSGAADVMFMPAGGKQRIPLIARSLSALGVPVRIVVDFDALNDLKILQALVESVDVAYSPEWERDRRVVDSHLRGSESPLKAGPLRDVICEILKGNDDAIVSRQAIAEIRQATQPSTGWRAAKQHGKGAVPAGQATVALESLLARLSAAGIYVVPYGAVESFVKEIGGKSAEWIAEVVEQNCLPTATRAHNFVDSVLHSLLDDEK